MRQQLFVWISVGALVVGCGGDERPGVSGVGPEPGAGGRVDVLDGGASSVAGHGGAAGNSTSGNVGEGGSSGASVGTAGSVAAAGSVATAGAAGSLAILPPAVLITAPDELAHPDDGAVLADNVEVFCSVEASEGSAPIDTTGVTIDLLDADGNLLNTVSADQTDTEGEFSAVLVVANQPSGVVNIVCTGSTSETVPVSGSDTIQQFIDHGPIITPIIPEEDEALVAQDVVMRFRIQPDPLADQDVGAAVSTMRIEVDGVEFDLQPTDTADEYEVLVPFEDTNVFDPMPTGTVNVGVYASNSRSPVPVSSALPYTFVLDGLGPSITITAPTALAVVGGDVTLVFDVVDDYSGVDPDTIRVLVNVTDPADAARYSPTSPAWGVNGNTYRYSFDSAAVQGSVVQMTVNITVLDLAGNVSKTATANYYIDNQPPYISLDPPAVRDVTRSGSTIECTHPFDPLGRAASDLDTIQLISRFRALVLARTNQIGGQTIFYDALTDETRVQLFLEPDPASAPLVIDTNDDGICDDINTVGRDVPQQELMPVSPKGEEPADPNIEALLADEEPTIDPIDVLPDTGQCYPNSSGGTVTICGGSSDLWRATGQLIGGAVRPVVYGVAVSDGSGGLACAGNDWELSPYVQQEGWVCLAAMAYDMVDNRGVSPPLRVCIDDTTTAFEPDCSPETAPSCTDGCTRQPELTYGERLMRQY